MNIQEYELEEYLYQHPELIRASFYTIDKWAARQFRVPSGVIDLLGMSDKGFLVIVELKKGRIKNTALAQINRYWHDIKNIIEYVSYDEQYIGKIVIGSGDISTQVLFEAQSMDISLFNYDVNMEIEISGSWGWSKEFREQLRSEYLDLSFSGVFKTFVDYKYAKMMRWEYGDKENDN